MLWDAPRRVNKPGEIHDTVSRLWVKTCKLSGFTLLPLLSLPVFRARDWVPVRGPIRVSWVGVKRAPFRSAGLRSRVWRAVGCCMLAVPLCVGGFAGVRVRCRVRGARAEVEELTTELQQELHGVKSSQVYVRPELSHSLIEKKTGWQGTFDMAIAHARAQPVARVRSVVFARGHRWPSAFVNAWILCFLRGHRLTMACNVPALPRSVSVKLLVRVFVRTR